MEQFYNVSISWNQLCGHFYLFIFPFSFSETICVLEQEKLWVKSLKCKTWKRHSEPFQGPELGAWIGVRAVENDI